MRRALLVWAAIAALLFGGSILIGSVDPSHAQRDRFDRRILIVNESSVTVVEVYATNVGRNEWGHDLLRDDIPPGRSREINVEDNTGYCLYDFRAVFNDGSTATRGRLNVCDAEEWTVSD
jgi:hypothetical protein